MEEPKRVRRAYEFGGNIGCFFWILFIPTAIYYFYGCTALGRGQLMVPDLQFWKSLWYDLPEGISIRPTWKALQIQIIWIAFTLLLQQAIPGEMKQGVTLKNGNKLWYKMNGLTSFAITHFVVTLLCSLGFMRPTIIYENMGAMLTMGVIISHVFALYLYIDFGVFWKRHINKPEFEEDYGIFTFKDFFFDYFLGTARNPRVCHFLGYPIDLKHYFNARPGLTIWVLNNWSCMAAQYYNCSYNSIQVTCDFDHGSWMNVSWAMWLICFAHWYYILDYNWNEPAYLTTTDIRHDQFGWMLTYGDWGFLPWFYSFSFTFYLNCLETKLMNNGIKVLNAAIVHVTSMILFRLANSQKNNFRTYLAKGGDLDKYTVWGQPVSYIRTEEGSILLTSGYWGLARHFNYIGDMMMCLGWAYACSGGTQFPWVPLSYCAYFWLMDIHRLFRDEGRCLRKYKKDWVSYCQRVKYKLLPGLF